MQAREVGGCVECGTPLEAGDRFCSSCGAALPAATPSAPEERTAPADAPPRSAVPPAREPRRPVPPRPSLSQLPPPAAAAVASGYGAVPTGTNGLAIASLVLGIVWMAGLGSLLALIFGVMAKNQIDGSGGRQSGRGMAVAGIVLGIVGLIGLVPILVANVSSSTPTAERHGVVQPLRHYRNPSGSMEPTLSVGTTVYIERRSFSPRVGDIVLFHPPASPTLEECGPIPHPATVGGQACAEPLPRKLSQTWLKRVVSRPGDEIYIKEGHVFRRAGGKGAFVREQDSYARKCGPAPECGFPQPIKIPPGHWFLMGDNRGESDDSRFWGPIPGSWIVGRARYCGRIGRRCAGVPR